MDTLCSHHIETHGGNRLRVWMTCAMAALVGLLFGLDIGAIAGALSFIAKDFHVSDRLQEWIVSSMMVGAAIGALLAGWLSFRLGRRYSLLLGAATFIVGALAYAFAPSPTILTVARLVFGAAVGIATFTGPLQPIN